MSSGVHILDCTIRDGSYVVDYQFTVEDTFIVARGLAAAGIRHIEVGHGLGLNAQNVGKGNAAITDAEYITSARAAVGDKGLIGCFFIPGIGTEDSLRAAVDAGLGFIRLGMDVDDHAKLEPFVRLAKSLGIEVWGNMMKSYLVPPKEFGEIARRVGEYGVDVVALVDSAGGMLPDDVAAYAEETVARTRTPIAFHGHDNLTLAVANCLRFVEGGGTYVDGSLAGLGRSGGNAATEVLAALLAQKDKLAAPVDWERLVEFADAVMQFCVPDHARPRAAQIATGLNFFHSSFGPVVEKAAADAEAPLFRTILRLAPQTRKKVTPEAAALAAQAAIKAAPSTSADNAAPFVDGDSLERLQPATIAALADRLRVQKGKSPQRRIVTVAHTPGLPAPRVGPLRKSYASIVAHVEVSSLEALSSVKAALQDEADLWVLDKRLGANATHFGNLPICFYDDDQVVAQAVSDALQMLQISTVVVAAGEAGQREAILRMARLAGANEKADALVACDANAPASAVDLANVREGGVVLLLQSGALTPDAYAEARGRNLPIWRLDCGAALVAEAERLLATRDRFHGAAGSRTLPNNVRVVAGGVVGQPGDIVVDHCQRPRFILGEADGRGGIRPLAETSSARSRAVQQWIIESWSL